MRFLISFCNLQELFMQKDIDIYLRRMPKLSSFKPVNMPPSKVNVHSAFTGREFNTTTYILCQWHWLSGSNQWLLIMPIFWSTKCEWKPPVMKQITTGHRSNIHRYGKRCKHSGHGITMASIRGHESVSKFEMIMQQIRTFGDEVFEWPTMVSSVISKIDIYF